MIRTHLVPETNNITVTIPDNYIGKKVEILVSTEEEVKDSNGKGDISRFKGILSPERANELQKFVEQLRNEWDRNI